jgi:hypothetical protein
LIFPSAPWLAYPLNRSRLAQPGRRLIPHTAVKSKRRQQMQHIQPVPVPVQHREHHLARKSHHRRVVEPRREFIERNALTVSNLDV